MCQGLAPWRVPTEVPRVSTLLYVDTHLFLCIIQSVVVVVNSLKAVYTCLAPFMGNHYGAVVSGFFIAPTRNRPCVGVNTTGMGDK